MVGNAHTARRVAHPPKGKERHKGSPPPPPPVFSGPRLCPRACSTQLAHRQALLPLWSLLPAWGHARCPEHGPHEDRDLQLGDSAASLRLSQCPPLQLPPEPAPVDRVSRACCSQRLIGGGLGDFPAITMAFSACANKTPVSIFTFQIPPKCMPASHFPGCRSEG